MPTATLWIMAAAGAVLTVFAVASFIPQARDEADELAKLNVYLVNKRVINKDDRQLTGDGERPPSPRYDLRQVLETGLGKRLGRSQRGTELAQQLARADLSLRPLEWILTEAGITLLVGLLAMLRFGNLLALPLGAVLGYLGCGRFLAFRVSRRKKKFDAQLSPMMMGLSNSIKAGYTFGQAIDLVAKNSPPPVNGELARVVRETQLGRPTIEALAKMVSRNDSEDLRLMLTAVQIQAQTGGNLATILDRIAFTVRERVRIKGEIKTITGQARASGWVLIVLPFALAGLLSALAPSYFTPMFHNPIGLALLGTAGFMILCGYGLIRKIVNIAV